MGQAQPESGWSLRWTNRLLSPRRVGAGWGGFQDGQVVLSCPPRDLRSPPSPGQDARRDKKSLGGLGTSVGNAKVPHREVPRDGRRPALRHLYVTPAAPKALSKQPPAKPPAALHPAEAAHLGGCSPPGLVLGKPGGAGSRAASHCTTAQAVGCSAGICSCHVLHLRHTASPPSPKNLGGAGPGLL